LSQSSLQIDARAGELKRALHRRWQRSREAAARPSRPRKGR
jgi:hypothetical protein